MPLKVTTLCGTEILFNPNIELKMLVAPLKLSALKKIQPTITHTNVSNLAKKLANALFVMKFKYLYFCFNWAHKLYVVMYVP